MKYYDIKPKKSLIASAKEKCYLHNIFNLTTLSNQILSSILLLIVNIR